MEYKVEKSLRDFEFWLGALDNARLLSPEELDTIEEGIEECTADGDIWTETEINDFVWFETDTIASWLGYQSWQELYDMRTE